jgi:DNA mismatch repair protein MutL
MVNRIAAGEVIERPASVVKELVENSLDAGAREISVWVERGGTSLIRVADDGEGIAPEDMPVAIERHSTSKLKGEHDLFSISTLGFRGEALPSIASVSRLEIASRTRQGEVGCCIRVEGGKKGTPTMMGCPAGATVEVRDLLFNIPARRKFLKSPATELSHICGVINRLALAFGDVHFQLRHSGKVLSDYVATPRLQDRVQQVLGADVADSMVSLAWNKGKTNISGFLSVAPGSFSNSRHLFTFVNRRFVRDRLLTHAVMEGYETLLMKGRYPAVVLFLDVPLAEVDVNVHPAKHEVRFRRQSEVHDAVAEAVREGLRKEAKGPLHGPVGQQDQAFIGVRETCLSYPDNALPDLEEVRRFSQVDSAGPTLPLGEIGKGFYSSLDVLGQLLGCYITCESTKGLVLIDQHAAHERIAFERMRSQIESGEIERQDLLVPQLVEFPSSESIVLEQMLARLDGLGFIVERFGANTYAIKSVPALLPPGDYRPVLWRMVADFAEVGRTAELKEGLEERLMTLACHSVIRANRKLSKQEMRALLEQLDRVDFATQCPHGRPVLIQLTQSQLERMFKRT